MSAAAADPTARRLWRVIEPLHAVTYFARECRDAHAAVGLRGFWMGYFGARAAPMGPVGPGVVAATFFGFHPAMVRRAIPDAWSCAPPAAVLRARRTAAAGVLRARAPGIEEVARHWGPVLADAVAAAEGSGRPLFAANRDLGAPDDRVEALWQACTCLREHRGDGHVALLVGEGLDGCEANVLAAAVKGIPEEVVREARGWSPEEWDAAAGRLAERGLFDAPGTPADDGVDLHRHVEHRTDELAGRPYEALGHDRVAGLLGALGPLAHAIASVIRFPNPMGLPPPPE